jgi:hypothetical protein
MLNISEIGNTTNTIDSHVVQMIPTVIDYTFRAICFIIHLIYFLAVLCYKELQLMSLLQMHHTNMIGLLTGLHYSIWIAWTAPATGNKILDNILCSLSEAFWAISKYARCYSILVLAVYRLVAVFHTNTFNKLVKSLKLAILSIFMVWLVSGAIFSLAKFTGHTLPGIIICYDGYSPILQNSIIYYVITSSLGYVLPTSLIVVVYVVIRLKLAQIGHKLNLTKRNRVRPNVFSISASLKVSNPSNNYKKASVLEPDMSLYKKRSAEKKLAQQFILINLFEIGSCVFLVMLSLTNVIVIFSTEKYYVRQLVRIGNLVCQSIIPIVSLIYSPVLKKINDRLKIWF